MGNVRLDAAMNVPKVRPGEKIAHAELKLPDPAVTTPTTGALESLHDLAVKMKVWYPDPDA